MTNLNGSRRATRWSSFCFLSAFSVASFAQAAEDSSRQFVVDMDALSAAMGLPNAESTLVTNGNGITRARVDLSSLKMLVVKSTPDGLVTDHVRTVEEMDAFKRDQRTASAAEE